jgi:UDP-N-acetylglucosamine 4,6-dehydratase/5-epimerase
MNLDKRVEDLFKGKSLMITGGTGSFGKTVLHRFLETEIKEIIIFSRDEKKQEDLRLRLNNPKLKFILGDVRCYDTINNAMKGVDYVFHAAALKQVPSCDFFPLEATKTNILGSENVINAAINHNVKKLILLSTDKAVYPINAMGISKAMAEKILQAQSRNLENNNILCITRYGNVMASRGSVIPLFVDAIKNNQPITITDPSMTRFMMSLEESVDLVLYAFAHGEQGDLFVQKASACTVEILAQALIKIFNSKVDMEIIGTRHGEKLYETLISREEMSKAVDLERYFKIPTDNRDLNYKKYERSGNISANLLDDYTSENTLRLNLDQTCDLLLKLDFIQEQLTS